MQIFKKQLGLLEILWGGSHIDAIDIVIYHVWKTVPSAFEQGDTRGMDGQ